MSGVYGRKNKKKEWKAWTDAALLKKLQSVYSQGLNKASVDHKNVINTFLANYSKQEQKDPHRRSMAYIKKNMPFTKNLRTSTGQTKSGRPYKKKAPLRKGTEMAQILQQGRKVFAQAWRIEKERLGYDDLTRPEKKESYAIFRLRWKREKGKPIPKKLRDDVAQIKIKSMGGPLPAAQKVEGLTLEGLGLRRRPRGRRTAGEGIIAGEFF